MSPFEALRQEIAKARGAVPSFVDDERAKRIEDAFARALNAASHVQLASSPSRMANRCPATVRTLERLAAELRCEGGAGWETRRAPVLETIARVIDACNELVRIERDGRARLLKVLQGAA